MVVAIKVVVCIVVVVFVMIVVIDIISVIVVRVFYIVKITGMEKTNSMNSAEFNFLKYFPPNFSFCPTTLAPSTCKLEITSRMSSSQLINEAKYVNSM